MENPTKLEWLQEVDGRLGVTNGSQRASLEKRRAGVLSYHQLVAEPGLLPNVAPPRPRVPSPAVKGDAPPQISAEDLARDPLAHPTAPPRPPRAARLVYEVVTEPLV